jgi:hypothetical protein
VPDKEQESLFDTGYSVGKLARELFPNGEEIAFDADNFNGMIAKTKELIANTTGSSLHRPYNPHSRKIIPIKITKLI